MGKNGFTFQVCKTPEEIMGSQNAELTILEGLGNNIIEHLGNIGLGRSLKIFVRDASQAVVGGVMANCFGGWVYISFLWIEKSIRNHGYGSELMHLVESEAIQLGCAHAHLEPYGFEARPFYEKLGCELFATLDDYPPGYRNIF